MNPPPPEISLTTFWGSKPSSLHLGHSSNCSVMECTSSNSPCTSHLYVYVGIQSSVQAIRVQYDKFFFNAVNFRANFRNFFPNLFYLRKLFIITSLSIVLNVFNLEDK